MKLLQKTNKLLVGFLFIIFLINLIQAYTTELIQDESYYWAYSNFLDWGYFDHPPMVAIWISISKLFFATGELSVRFFATITLPITFYITWLLIQHPKKKEYSWLFIVLTLSTSLFNVYGFITVPDTPLLFFMAFFLYGYQKYLEKKSWFSYLVLTLTIVGMMYSKYQAILIVFFVLLSNIKVLKDYKIWIMTFLVILLYTPHLYWQFINDYPSFRYHLFERKRSQSYNVENTLLFFVNMIAIIGFTFPIIYYAFFKNLKNKIPFLKALNYITVGFIAFFFISTFKGKTQAQWIVPISIPLIIIPFYYLIENKQKIKSFLWLAGITICITTSARFIMANDNILPIKLEMHGNKEWVTNLDTKLNGKTPLFINSFQNTSLYWFYTNKRPFQYNSWYSRKNQYDLFDYNKNVVGKDFIEVGPFKHASSIGSLVKKNKKELYLKSIASYQKEDIFINSETVPLLKEGQLNRFKIGILNKNNIDLNKVKFEIIIRDKAKNYFKQNNSKYATSFKAKLIDTDQIEFLAPNFDSGFIPAYIQIIGNINKNTHPVKMGLFKCDYKK